MDTLNKTLQGPQLIRIGALVLLAALSKQCLAAPEEIQVYMDELNSPGQFGLDVHANYVIAGSGTPAYPGAQASRHVWRLTPEFSYGLTPSLELGAYLLASVDSGGNSTIDGQKLRLKFIAPKAADQAYFWGANLEVGRVAHRLDENPWNGELKGILGYRGGPWTFAFNPNFGWKISGPVASPGTLGVDSKVAYSIDEGLAIGMESYNELGQVRHLGHLNQQSQTLFGVLDVTLRGWDLNLGLGRGLTPASDRWLMKAVLGVPFGTK